MAEVACSFEQTFSFTPLEKTFPFLQDKDTLQLLLKWSMLGRISAQCYSFDQKFHPYSGKDFAQSFFKDPNVGASLRKMEASGTGAWIPFGGPVVSVEVEPVPCTKVSMDLFDPIYACEIVRSSGHVVKCYHEAHPDYDELRRMLQDEDSENYHTVGGEERAEFLFRLFKHLCLGGELCQYEDLVAPYLDATRRVYKDLVSVAKDPETKEISVVSTVLKVSAYDVSGRCYPARQDHEQTFAYMIVDPFKRHVCVLYHCYGVGTLTL